MSKLKIKLENSLKELNSNYEHLYTAWEKINEDIKLISSKSLPHIQEIGGRILRDITSEIATDGGGKFKKLIERVAECASQKEYKKIVEILYKDEGGAIAKEMESNIKSLYGQFAEFIKSAKACDIQLKGIQEKAAGICLDSGKIPHQNEAKDTVEESKNSIAGDKKPKAITASGSQMKAFDECQKALYALVELSSNLELKQELEKVLTE